MKTNWLGWALLVAVAGCAVDKDGDDAGLSGADSAATGDTDASGSGGGADAASDTDGASDDASAADAGDSDATAADDGATSPGSDAGDGMDASANGDAGGSTPEPDAASAADASGADATSSSDASAADTGASGDGQVTRDEYCSGRGSVIKVPGTAAGATRDLCTGTVARQRFKNAICTCENLDARGYIETGSFSASKDEPGTFTLAGGSVGVNGSLGIAWDPIVSAGYAKIGGSLRTYEGSTYSGFVETYGDFEANGPVHINGYYKVARDAKLHGGFSVLGWVNVGRDAWNPPGQWGVPWISVVGGERVEQEFSLEKPCACGPKDLLDVDAIVRDGKTKNDNNNPAVNLSPTALTRLDFARRVELPCGRFYVDEISGVGDVHLVVNGRTALFVGGDVRTTGHFDVEIGPQGELDLFIAGDLLQVGYGQFGDLNRPSAVRVYVGGDGDIFFRGYQPFGANLYAPRSHLHSDGFINAKGSLFVRSIADNGYLKVAYDRDVLDLGDDDACNPPPVTPPPVDPPPGNPPPVDPPQCEHVCDESCGQSSCKNGMCVGCQKDSDCCEPLVCYPDGRCGPLLL
jgi:hypothetical protein